MALVRPVFLDTSVLLGGLIEIGAAGEAAQRVMAAIADRRVRSAKTAWHCCLEFYSVATRLPGELRLSPEDALRLIEAEILARFEVHELPRRERVTLLRAAAPEGVWGGRIYDAHIAEVARLARARLVVTENRRHFIMLLQYGIGVVTAAEFARESGLARFADQWNSGPSRAETG